METSRNIARVSAQLLRASVENLTAIAEELEHYSTTPAPPDPAEPKKPYYDNPVMIDGFPRSHRMNHWTPAEKAISDALQVVEEVGADVLLTDAVILLGDAQRKVAEYVDRQIQARE